jgi:hypothetical protein
MTAWLYRMARRLLLLLLLLLLQVADTRAVMQQ